MKKFNRVLYSMIVKNGIDLKSVNFTKITTEQVIFTSNGEEYEAFVDQNIINKIIKNEPVVEPVIEEPVIEEPVIEEPVIEEPIVEEPIVEEPIVEEPVIEEPVIEEPVVKPVKRSEVLEPIVNRKKRANRLKTKKVK